MSELQIAYNTVPFFTLNAGDFFRDEDGVLMLKTCHIQSFNGHSYNCVSLPNACPYSLDDDARVTKIDKVVLTVG
jgi:hypothetical protein